MSDLSMQDVAPPDPSLKETQPRRPDRVRALQASVAPALALLAGMELDLFSAFGDEVFTPAEVAARLRVEQERLERLLYALVLAGLLELDGERFRNGAEARAFLVRGRADFIGDEHELLGELWRADLCTAASIRSGGPAAKHDFSVADEAASAAFFRGLVPSTVAFGRELASVADFSDIRSVVDIGGGPGGTLWALRERHPHLRPTLLELPSGVSLARAIAADNAQADGLVFEEGDIVQAPTTAMHDAAILKAIIQVLPPQAAAAAIRNAYASLTPGGTLYISGAGILGDDRLSPAHAVFYNLTFLNLYDGGRAYTRSEYAAWLSGAGFTDVTFTTLTSGSTLISARRP